MLDAVPKKRGPKTDVLEALLKRVDGLEAKLKEKNADEDLTKTVESAIDEVDEEEPTNDVEATAPKRVATRTCRSSNEVEPGIATDVKPSSRHTPHPNGSQGAVKLSEEYALRARQSVDTDDPSIESLQALLLLVLAFTASGHGKKAHMLMSSAIGMAMALELHREIDAQVRVSPVERELRRRLFWTCYLLDHHQTCGSKRSSLINDSSIALRLPSWCPSQSSPPVDGEFFQQGSNLQHYQGNGKKPQGSTGMLIDITRLLGMTNRYLAAGGVKGDSHFPWHSLSTLSEIRQELDFWASGAGPVFSGLHALLRWTESTVVFLSKLIYHLIHCLAYRPFLPIDLAELAGNGQHQSWQIEATNVCFLHANAIGELVNAARQAGTVEWPAIVGYCISTAGTVHIHGAYYTIPSAHGGDVNLFAASSGLLSLEMQCLKELHFAWASVEQQSDTLQGIYTAHGELVQGMMSSSMGYTPGFHLEEFFDRYLNIGGPGGVSYRFDPAHLSMSSYTHSEGCGAHSVERPSHKRKKTASPSQKKRPDVRKSNGQEQSVIPPPHHTTELLSFRPSSIQPARQHQHQHQTSQAPMQQQRASDSFGASIDAGGASSATLQSYGATMPAGGATTNRGTLPVGGTGTGTGIISTSTAFDQSFGYTPSSNMKSSANDTHTSYDAMFGSLASHTFSRPAGWQTDEGAQHGVNMSHGDMISPGTKSTSGSTATGQGDEKDPFLSLLEQLAEDHGQHFDGAGTDFDFFFGRE
ncbi:hypothetical protein EsHS_00006110 [Epichloe bromicola]